MLTVGITYWVTIYPRARREIRHWKRRAQQIPDPTLRADALDKLTQEHLNPEAAALFAILAPRRNRPLLVRLIVAFQVAYDYLDAINEPPTSASLRNGLQLHRSLGDAVSARSSLIDYYKYHPQTDDGGYLAALVHRCQVSVRSLPSTAIIGPVLVEAAQRCGEAQSYNHAALLEGPEQLIRWTTAKTAPNGYLWWELAAGGISCLALHALFAAAACTTTLEEANQIHEAYFPSVCALSALLDSLIDLPGDSLGTNHSFVRHYATCTDAAERFSAITKEAGERLGQTRGAARHGVLLAGIACFYLSASEAHTNFAQPVALGALSTLGPITTPMLTVMRIMRHKAKRRR